MGILAHTVGYHNIGVLFVRPLIKIFMLKNSKECIWFTFDLIGWFSSTQKNPGEPVTIPRIKSILTERKPLTDEYFFINLQFIFGKPPIWHSKSIHLITPQCVVCWEMFSPSDLDAQKTYIINSIGSICWYRKTNANMINVFSWKIQF